MPAKKKSGIGRINIRCEDWFADRVAEAAAQTGRSLSSYVRIALIEQMKRDGISTAPPADAHPESAGGEPVKRRGRPKKLPPAATRQHADRTSAKRARKGKGS
jgi:hypothetical protein